MVKEEAPSDNLFEENERLKKEVARLQEQVADLISELVVDRAIAQGSEFDATHPGDY